MITIGGKDIADIVIDNKNVVKVQDATTLEIMWQKTTPVVVDYFYIENTYSGSNTITINTIDQSPIANHATSLQYSKDQSTWTTITLSGTNTILMNSGEKVYFRNNNGYFNCIDFKTIFSCNKKHKVGGNINTLLNYQNLSGVTLSEDCFLELFNGNTTLRNAYNLTLPSMILAPSCYVNMFYNCTNLTSPPRILPATTLTSGCYNEMFSGCTSLMVTPELPATTLAQYCYRQMFWNCTNLEDAPSLVATTLAQGCYKQMFAGCTSMTNAMYWLPATTLAEDCYWGMFAGCSALTTAPQLLATTLEDGCYYWMFQNCSSLNSVTTNANDISAPDCLYNWLQGVSNSGTFHNLGSATYPTGTSGIPSGWTEVNS